MTMPPALRKFALTIHLMASLGWIGAAGAYIALGVSAITARQGQSVRAAWVAMEVTGWFVIAPLALAALLTGLIMSLGTPWGLFRHYWVLISLALTTFAATVTLLHMPAVTAQTDVARRADAAALNQLGGDLFHPVVGLAVLLFITLLNMYKPRGLTPYGRRRQQHDRGRRGDRAPSRTTVTSQRAATEPSPHSARKAVQGGPS